MNPESIASQIDRQYDYIAAHLRSIQQAMEQIELLKKMQGQERKKSGIGDRVAAERVARLVKT